MKNSLFQIIMLLTMATHISCYRQVLEDPISVLAKIPVEVDWTESGINITKGVGQNYVHRTSFRFFPKDGSKPFEEYLEGDVTSGIILVPIGEYSILVTNESVEFDKYYWEDFFTFNFIDDFDKLHASMLKFDITKHTSTDGPLPAISDFYNPSIGEVFVYEAHKLAFSRVLDFVVTPELVTRTRNENLTKSEIDDITLKVKMEQKHADIKVITKFENIKSALAVNAAAIGFASNSNIETPATLFFRFSEREIESNGIFGTVEYTFRSFGKLKSPSNYFLELDVILTDGTRYTPEIPLRYDVSDSVNVQTTKDFTITIDEVISLPEISGDVEVGDWEDDENIDLT